MRTIGMNCAALGKTQESKNEQAWVGSVTCSRTTQRERKIQSELSLIVFLLALSLGLGSASLSAEQHGFLVFSSQGVANYLQDPRDGLVLAGKASGDRADYITDNGNIYYMHKLLGTIAKLGADLKPVLEAKIDRGGDIPYWLGAWNQGLLVLNDNKVLYLDASLKVVARLPLSPRKYDQITPALNPKGFLVWKEHGYLLSNTGELFVIPLGIPSAYEQLKSEIHGEDGLIATSQWIDPDEGTLSLLGHTQKEDHGSDLKLGESRIVYNDVVLTYRLKSLVDQPQRAVIYEKNELRVSTGHESSNGPQDDGRVFERMPPYHVKSKAKGVHIESMSGSTPAYAEAFLEDAAPAMPPRAILRLKSLGHYEIQQITRDLSGTSLLIDGKRYYVEGDLEDHSLRLQPESYLHLRSLPGLAGTYYTAVAY